MNITDESKVRIKNARDKFGVDGLDEDILFRSLDYNLATAIIRAEKWLELQNHGSSLTVHIRVLIEALKSEHRNVVLIGRQRECTLEPVTAQPRLLEVAS